MYSPYLAYLYDCWMKSGSKNASLLVSYSLMFLYEARLDNCYKLLYRQPHGCHYSVDWTGLDCLDYLYNCKTTMSYGALQIIIVYSPSELTTNDYITSLRIIL